jgi:predicted nucleotidyltransferase
MEALGILCEIAEKDSVPFVLIGALVPALWIKVNRRDAMSPGIRGTKDADATVKVKSWEEFEHFIQQLMTKGFGRREKEAEHRLHYGNASIDLIPYGHALLVDGYLEWPRSGWRMNMKGFDQVFVCAKKCELVPDLNIDVVPLWLFVVLKMGAYLDRHYRRDVVDIIYVLEYYEENDEDSRRFDVIIEGLTYETSGAFLMGKDIKKNANDNGIGVVRIFLSLIDTPYAKPVQDVLWEEGRGTSEVRRRHLYDLFEFFSRGLGSEEGRIE